MGIYGLGVLQYLIENEIIDPYVVRVAGASSGAQSVAFACGVSVDTMIAQANATIQLCRYDPYGCLGKLDALSLAGLNASFPPGYAFELCNGRIYIQMTQVNGTLAQPTGQFPPNECPAWQTFWEGGELINWFNSRDDLITAMAGSSFIVGASSFTKCAEQWRDQYVIDGGYSDVMPCPPGNTSCLSISTYLPGQLIFNGVPYVAQIYPGIRGNGTLPINPASAYNAAKLNAYLIAPYVDQIIMAGRDDAAYWLQLQRANPQSPFTQHYYWFGVGAGILGFFGFAGALVMRRRSHRSEIGEAQQNSVVVAITESANPQFETRV